MQTQIHKHSFLDLLLSKPTPMWQREPLPEGVIHRSSFSNEARNQKQRVHITKEKKEVLRQAIKKVLKKGNKNFQSVYAEILEKQPDIIPANEFGEKISEYAIRELVLQVKKELWGDFKNRNAKKVIVEMFKNGFSQSEIKDKLDCTPGHVTAMLVEAGLIERKYKQKAK